MKTRFIETEKQIAGNEIKELELKLNFKFPDSYKDHILKNNGGRCEPNVFFFEEQGTSSNSSVDWFLAIYDGEYDNLENYFVMYKIAEERMPNSLFPIAHDPGGNLICMDSRDGKIYFWDHEKEPSHKNPIFNGWENVYFVSNSINEFLKNLRNL
ncbi:MAG: SMI1/KNR4 family protein [Bacteroidota bacterium]